ncbi:flagellar biosynthetic protein FliO [Oceanobacillus sp. CAU 1775]
MKWIKYIALAVFILLPFSVSAETDYVEDCLENPEACEEDLDEPVIDTNENDGSDLLGQETGSSSLFFEIIKMFFALLLVLALIYIFLYFLKRRNKLGNRIKSLENIGGLSVGQNKSIQIIRLGSQVYVVGVGEEITLLKEIDDKELIDQLLLEAEEETTDFSADTILSMFQKKNDRKQENENDFKNLFNEELSDLKNKRKNIINRHKEDHNE